jgi:hypothetical protein
MSDHITIRAKLADGSVTTLEARELVLDAGSSGALTVHYVPDKDPMELSFSTQYKDTGEDWFTFVVRPAGGNWIYLQLERNKGRKRRTSGDSEADG